jgi:predicted alpha/beta-hydrolase family hydrolase
MTGPGGLVLFHGAGGDRDHRLFLALEAALELPVARCNFPYRDKGPGRRPPDRMPKLIDSIVEQTGDLAEQWGVDPASLVLGGRSMGGRACSMAVADGRVEAAGLLLLSYPLHPPGKPDRLRIEHFGAIGCPVLLIQGSSDPFGKEPEFAEHVGAIPAPVEQVWLDKTGHDPVAKHDPAILEATAEWLARLSAA